MISCPAKLEAGQRQCHRAPRAANSQLSSNPSQIVGGIQYQGPILNIEFNAAIIRDQPFDVETACLLYQVLYYILYNINRVY
jgi:hypothetical protein